MLTQNLDFAEGSRLAYRISCLAGSPHMQPASTICALTPVAPRKASWASMVTGTASAQHTSTSGTCVIGLAQLTQPNQGRQTAINNMLMTRCSACLQCLGLTAHVSVSRTKKHEEARQPRRRTSLPAAARSPLLLRFSLTRLTLRGCT